jgi:hypothetical protein
MTLLAIREQTGGSVPVSVRRRALWPALRPRQPARAMARPSYQPVDGIKQHNGFLR